MKPKIFNEEDKKFQGKIIDALMRRHIINMNKEVGTAHFDPINEDRINPCVTITRDDIARETKREKVRDSVLKEYAEAMKIGSFEVTADLKRKTLRVCISPRRAPEIEFTSIETLCDKNAVDLEQDPDLAADPYA